MIKNIAIIVIDAFRFSNLSLFGYNKEIDKNIKKVAEQSFVFKNFFSCSNATAPSLMSIFTGRFPNNHGIIHQFPYTKDQEIEKMYVERNFWLPSFLKDKGFATIAVDWIGMFFKDGFDYYKEREDWQGKMDSSAKFSPARDTMDLAISKIGENKANPFFSFIHFWDTHFPFPTTEYEVVEEKQPDEILKEIQGSAQKEFFKKRIETANLEFYSAGKMAEKYDKAIEEIDKQIGKLYSYLKENNLLENTALFLLGDHGTNLTEHNIYFSSSSLFDQTIHVPFIAFLPGFGKGEVDSFGQNTDIVPTILELLGQEQEDLWRIDGRSIIDIIKKRKEDRTKVFFFDGLAENITGFRTKNSKTIIAKDPFCYLCKSSHHQKEEEYDLEKDPGEINNLKKVVE